MNAYIADDLGDGAMGLFAAGGVVLLEEMLAKYAEFARLFPDEADGGTLGSPGEQA